MYLPTMPLKHDVDDNCNHIAGDYVNDDNDDDDDNNDDYDDDDDDEVDNEEGLISVI